MKKPNWSDGLTFLKKGALVDMVHSLRRDIAIKDQKLRVIFGYNDDLPAEVLIAYFKRQAKDGLNCKEF